MSPAHAQPKKAGQHAARADTAFVHAVKAAGLTPAITFCDLRMPRLSGFELLSRVRADARLGAMPFVLVSAATDRDSVDQAGGLGAQGFLTKPFEPGQVRAHLAAASSAGEDDEAPAVTMRRLGIDAPRLLLYLGGLHKQLVAASATMEQLIACADDDGARRELARLHEGCHTLGLARAAAALAALQTPAAPAAGAVEEALALARLTALRHSEAVRAIAH